MKTLIFLILIFLVASTFEALPRGEAAGRGHSHGEESPETGSTLPPNTNGETGSGHGPGWDYSWAWGSSPEGGWGFGSGSGKSPSGSGQGFGYGFGSGPEGKGYGFGYGSSGRGGSDTPSAPAGSVKRVSP